MKALGWDYRPWELLHARIFAVVSAVVTFAHLSTLLERLPKDRLHWLPS